LRSSHRSGGQKLEGKEVLAEVLLAERAYFLLSVGFMKICAVIWYLLGVCPTCREGSGDWCGLSRGGSSTSSTLAVCLSSEDCWPQLFVALFELRKSSITLKRYLYAAMCGIYELRNRNLGATVV
jgi:hypothetical protein